MIPSVWEKPMPSQSTCSVRPVRHTCILSPKHTKRFSADFHKLIKQFEAGEFTHAKATPPSSVCDSTSESQLGDESSESLLRTSDRKQVTFVTKTGEGESSVVFKEKTRKVEAGEYRVVLGGLRIGPLDLNSVWTADRPHATPKKTFETKEEKASFLRSEAREAKNKARLGV